MIQQTKQTSKNFIEKNLKWVTLILLALFLFKSAQSCVRTMTTTSKERKNEHIIDSLIKKVDILERKIELSEAELKIKNEMIDTYKDQIDKKDGKPITIINNIPNQRDTIKKK